MSNRNNMTGVPSSSDVVPSSSLSSSNVTGSSGGNTNVGSQLEVMDLTAASMKERQTHQSMLLDIEAKKRAFQVDVPTLPHDVRTALRNIGLPVRLFGENLANVRDRLRMALAKQLVLQERGITSENDLLMTTTMETITSTATTLDESKKIQSRKQQLLQEQEQVTKFSRATQELIIAREKISKFSLQRSQQRLCKERTYRVQWQRKRARLASSLINENNDEEEEEEELEDDLIKTMDTSCFKCFKSLRKIGLEGSQYGDTRPLSCITTSSAQYNVAGYSGIVATSSWSGTIKLWDGSSPELNLLGTKTMAHEDRIMGIALQYPQSNSNNINNQQIVNTDSTMIATASIDLTAKLWKVEKRDDVVDGDDTTMNTADDDEENNDNNSIFTIQEMQHLKGHAARLCKVAFHPQGDYVGTTSFDHTWRLWDVETGKQILLQDGHWKEVYGIGFHPDGSLCSTTDYGSIVHCWDLRTGKSICHFLGHAKRVLCCEFSPNGYQLATSGDDGTIKIWDLRKRKQFASLPAHSNLVTQLKFDTNMYHNNNNNSNTNMNGYGGGSNPTSPGEFLVSSSFDGTAKIWSTRDWKMLATLRGHQGKVMGVGVLPNSTIVTSGFDKTIKLWR